MEVLKYPTAIYLFHLIRKSTYLYMYFPISTPIIIIFQAIIVGFWFANSIVRGRIVEKMYLTPDLLHIVNVYQNRGLVNINNKF